MTKAPAVRLLAEMELRDLARQLLALEAGAIAAAATMDTPEGAVDHLATLAQDAQR